MNMQATYSPDDNKLRLYASGRLDDETYSRVKAAGFRWAPKQDLFVAPMWTPGREDLLLSLCEEIDDEDTGFAERAEQRAERFDEYSGNRAKDAEAARLNVAAIADGIPMGQPILIGHHSERHARRDAARIENGMRKAVRMWETAEYWSQRAAGAIRSAKYKERPDVRARRIKKLEAERRKRIRIRDEALLSMKAWSAEGLTLSQALAIANYSHLSFEFPLTDYPRQPPASQYEGPMGLWSAMEGGIIAEEQARALALPAHERTAARCDRWISHYDNRLTYERAMLAEAGGTVADKSAPEKGGACKCWASPRGGWSYIVRVNKVSVSVLDNWGNGGGNFLRTIPFDKLASVMSAAEVQAARDEGRLVDCPDGTGFFLSDGPGPNKPESKAEQNDRLHEEHMAGRETAGADFASMKAALSHGVQIVTAPQLFATPAPIAQRMVDLADIQPGHDVLEPSAGTGAILRLIGDAPKKTAVEVNHSLAGALLQTGGSGLHVVNADFLECNGDLGTFDRIVMNPPFERGADIKHIRHALTMLKPGGRMVTLCANGPRQREALQPLATSWDDLPEGSFKAAGTSVNVALVVIDG